MQKYTTFSLHKRLLVIALIIVFLFFVVFVKLFCVQIISGKKLQTKAISQWTRDLSLHGLRGDIVDRNGDVLAKSYTSYSVYVRSVMVKNAEEVALLLSETLNLDYGKTLQKVKDRSVSERLIKEQVPFEKAKDLIGANLDGIILGETSSRYYPYDNLLSNVLGYCTIDNIGQSGLERYYDSFLHGIDGTTYVESTLTGMELSNATTSFIEGKKGSTISLTIDLTMQQFLQSICEMAEREQQAQSVCSIIMDAQNGEVLAMANSQSLNLNSLPRDDISNLLEQSKNMVWVYLN